MGKYEEFLKEAKATSKGTNYSKGGMVGLATAMFNDTECSIKTYVKKGESYEEKPMYPSKEIRENLIAPILKNFGVDKAEMSRLNDVQTSRAGGEALTDFALLLVKEYVSQEGLGRKLTLPMTSATESVQTLSTYSAEKDAKETTMIVRGEDGTYSTTPTGKTVTTEAHERLKVGNRVPAWLKSVDETKK